MSADEKAWGGRFESSIDKFVEEFTESLSFDQRLWVHDIKGSMAHARMLADQGVISDADAEAIVDALGRVYRDISDGTFEFASADEDIHMAVERAVIDAAGPAGGRLHTARSRNDQVALDMRMYAKETALSLVEKANALRTTLLGIAREHEAVVMPGYTHLQKAQPVLFAHHMLAYSWMLTRDVVRFRHAFEAADAMPLGSAALAGTSFPIDREAVAERLGFSRLTENSMDSVSDRDFLLDLVYACTVTMVHLSRLCEELVLWSTEEFGFVAMDDAWATGSSIMPQKKNPDVAELTRGKTGRVVGDLVGLLVTLKGLPLTSNRDLQEDKPAAFDALDATADALRAVDGMVGSMTVKKDALRAGALGGFMAATDLADHLAESGLPFRQAHEVVGRLVLECERKGKTLQDLTLEELKEHSDDFGEAALAAVDVDAMIARRTSKGGTAPEAVADQVRAAEAALAADEAWVAERSED